jgi:hypothetical protein
VLTISQTSFVAGVGVVLARSIRSVARCWIASGDAVGFSRPSTCALDRVEVKFSAILLTDGLVVVGTDEDRCLVYCVSTVTKSSSS